MSTNERPLSEGSVQRADWSEFIAELAERLRKEFRGAKFDETPQERRIAIQIPRGLDRGPDCVSRIREAMLACAHGSDYSTVPILVVRGAPLPHYAHLDPTYTTQREWVESATCRVCGEEANARCHTPPEGLTPDELSHNAALVHADDRP